MSVEEDVKAISQYFLAAHPVTDAGKSVVAKFLPWYNDLGWYAFNVDSSNTLLVAKKYRDTYNEVEGKKTSFVNRPMTTADEVAIKNLGTTTHYANPLENALLGNTPSTFENPILNTLFGHPTSTVQLAVSKVAKPLVYTGAAIATLFGVVKLLSYTPQGKLLAAFGKKYSRE
jgi:hypothetical protein